MSLASFSKATPFQMTQAASANAGGVGVNSIALGGGYSNTATLPQATGSLTNGVYTLSASYVGSCGVYEAGVLFPANATTFTLSNANTAGVSANSIVFGTAGDVINAGSGSNASQIWATPGVGQITFSLPTATTPNTSPTPFSYQVWNFPA